MEYECSPLTWEFCYQQQEEGLEELRHSLLYTTLELEATISSAKDEITRRECELIHVNDLLSRAVKERDEAQAKCRKLMLEKLELQQEQNEYEPRGGVSEKQYSSAGGAAAVDSSDDCEGNSSDSSSSRGGVLLGVPSPRPTFQLSVEELAKMKPLPEKGKLLKAVVEAGPLLQTILLAGPLPRWQHPPPHLNSIEIPPVAINSPQDCSKSISLSNKRDISLSDDGGGDECCPLSKCRKVLQ